MAFSFSSIRYILSLVLLANAVAAQALTNYTVDNTSSKIAYVGVWDPTTSHTSALDVGGSHTLSMDPNGSATFTFTGVAVYYFSPKWPYTVNSYLSIDGGLRMLVDMTAPAQNSPNGEETVTSAILWSATNLANGIHRVVVTRGPAGFAVVDGFRYTTRSGGSTSQIATTVISTRTIEGSTTTTVFTTRGSTTTAVFTAEPSIVTAVFTVEPETTNTESSPLDPSDPTPTGTPAQSDSTGIIAATVSASVAGLVLLIGLILFFVRRKKRANHRSLGYGSGAGEGGGAYNIPSSSPNTYSAVPLAEKAAYDYPYSNAGVHSAGMVGLGGAMMGEVGARDSRYSAMGYSDGANSASLAGSLSGQQMTYANAPTYGGDPYGLHPVTNRALVMPSLGVAEYNTAGVGSGAAGYNNYNGGGAIGYGTEAGSASRPLSVNSNLPPGAAAPQGRPPSPTFEKARYQGAYNQRAYDPDSIRVDPTPGASGSSPTTPHPHAALGPSAPPPYAVQQDGSESLPRITPGSPPRATQGYT